jgi:SET domain-containing protein
MQTSGPAGQYQIWQGRQGNYTRFVNHSCQPNSQYENFSWLGVQRIVLVSKGISMGAEITVDYSNDYWDHLDKECLCGESRCRFKRKKT